MAADQTAGNFISWIAHNEHWMAIGSFPTSSQDDKNLCVTFRFSKIEYASSRLLLADSNSNRMEAEPGYGLDYEGKHTTGWHFNPCDVNDPALNSSSPQYTQSDHHFPTDRHRGRINGMYCDGHVGTYNTKTDALDYMRAVCFPEVARVR